MSIQTINDASKLFLNCAHEYEFALANGKRLKNVQELAEAFLSLSHDEFYNHANFHKNDFANWMEYVFHLREEAEELRNLITLEESSKYLKDLINKAKEVRMKDKDIKDRMEELRSKVPKPSMPTPPKKEEAAPTLQSVPIQIIASPPAPVKESAPIIIIENKTNITEDEKAMRREEVEKTLKELTQSLKKPLPPMKNEIKKPQDPKKAHEFIPKYTFHQVVTNPVLWIGLLTGLIMGILFTAFAYSLLDI